MQKKLFTYSCPTCHSKVMVPPVEDVLVTLFVSGINKAIGQEMETIRGECVEENEVTGTDYFTGLFLYCPQERCSMIDFVTSARHKNTVE